jgi:hypothetical protein
MSSIKFALECHLSKESGEMEFSEITIIGERDWISNVFDESMAADELKNYEQIEELPDGQYHIFVIGNTDWWVDHTMDGVSRITWWSVSTYT